MFKRERNGKIHSDYMASSSSLVCVPTRSGLRLQSLRPAEPGLYSDRSQIECWIRFHLNFALF